MFGMKRNTAEKPEHEDFVASALKMRLRLLQPVVVPCYLDHFRHAGFSKDQLPSWPEDESAEDDMQPHVTALICRLLEIACQPPPDRQQQQVVAKSIHPCLTGSPGTVVAPLYIPLVLDKDRQDIRLLTILPGIDDDINCSLAVVNLCKAVSYDALSYVWGTPTPTKVIKVNDHAVDVGPNLFSALYNLRSREKPLSLWVDALCINQQDDAEKSWQVAMMADIYRHAENVRVYVGEKGDAEPLFSFLNRDVTGDELDDLDKATARSGTPILDLMRAYVDFSLRPWFSRIWVFQEFAVASRPPIWHCGRHSASNDWLKRDLTMLFHRCVEIQTPLFGETDFDFVEGMEYSDFTERLNVVALIVFRPSLSMNFRSLPMLEYRSRRRISTDSRDLVFGLREFFEPAFQDAFRPDYTAGLGELFMRLSAWMLVMDRWGDVFKAYPKRLSAELPSWVRDFTPLPPQRKMRHEKNAHNTPLELVCSIHQQIMSAEGVMLDEIAHVFDIDEENERELMSKLWHLDQLFTRVKTDPELDSSVLIPLDTTQPLNEWLTNTANGESMLLCSPERYAFPRLVTAIMQPHIDKALQACANLEQPTDEMLAGVPPRDAIALLEDFSAHHTQLTNVAHQLLNLRNFVMEDFIDSRDFVAASLYDYESFVRQIKEYKDSPSQKYSLPSPMSQEILTDNHVPLNHGPGTITYTKTIDTLRENGSSLGIGLLLQMAEAIHTGKLGGDDVWELPFEDFHLPLDKEVDRLDQVERETVVFPSRMTAGSKGEKSESGDGVGQLELVDSTRVDASNRNGLTSLRSRAGKVPKIGNAGKDLVARLCNSSIHDFKHCTFFVTKGGLPGVGTPGVRGIQQNDKLIWLNDMYHPLLVRSATQDGGQHHEVVGTAVVRGIMGGKLRELGDKRPPLQKFTFI